MSDPTGSTEAPVPSTEHPALPTGDWPEIAQRLILGMLIVGLPLVLTLAWYHGHKGLQSVGLGELMIAAILIVIGEGEQKSQALGRTSPDTVKPTHAANEPQPTSAKPRIAILPFENLSPDPNNAFFADGLHEEILTALANGTRGLEVISRTTMMLYCAAPNRSPRSPKSLARRMCSKAPCGVRAMGCV